MPTQRINQCDVQVDDHKYCTGQYADQAHAIASLRAEADRLARLATFVESETWDTDGAA